MSSQSTSAMLTQLRVSADVQWANGRRPALASGINGVSFEEQVEAGLRVRVSCVATFTRISLVSLNSTGTVGAYRVSATD